eukprot:6163751-Amphidinium_carterae.2
MANIDQLAEQLQQELQQQHQRVQQVEAENARLQTSQRRSRSLASSHPSTVCSNSRPPSVSGRQRGLASHPPLVGKKRSGENGPSSLRVSWLACMEKV